MYRNSSARNLGSAMIDEIERARA
eukprot:COSAG06_NODE_7020_length_2672_cov_2.574038_1_plen_23_part_10